MLVKRKIILLDHGKFIYRNNAPVFKEPIYAQIELIVIFTLFIFMMKLFDKNECVFNFVIA